eukprot:6388475-Amphidinium_carterae.2
MAAQLSSLACFSELITFNLSVVVSASESLQWLQTSFAAGGGERDQTWTGQLRSGAFRGKWPFTAPSA